MSRRPAVHRPLTPRHLLIQRSTPTLVYLHRIQSLFRPHIQKRSTLDTRMSTPNLPVVLEAMGKAIVKLERLIDMLDRNIKVMREQGETIVFDDTEQGCVRRKVETCRITLTLNELKLN